MQFQMKDELYHNPLATAEDVKDFVMEGNGVASFPMGRLRLESTREADEGQAANIVYWCPQSFPDHIAISWDYYPIREPGLSILFFAATGRAGEDVLAPRLSRRSGPYDQYHHGDINALHVSYFRRRYPEERAFHTCNLRKSYGFHLVAQGADPIPDVADATPPYRIQVVKAGPDVLFQINDLPLFHWHDDGERFGKQLTSGAVGFRQMCPLIAEYANFAVHRVDLALSTFSDIEKKSSGKC